MGPASWSSKEKRSSSNRAREPWERIYRVTVDIPISLEMEKPIKRLRGKRRSKYDPILDQFIELGQDLVEIEVEGKKPSYVVGMLKKRIKVRGLEIKPHLVLLLVSRLSRIWGI